MSVMRVFFFCNAVDDEIKRHRRLSGDSPAATRKVVNLCIALKAAGVKPVILSMGRGRANNRPVIYGSEVRRISGIPVLYFPYAGIRFFSEILSAVWPAMWLLQKKPRVPSVVLYYNRTALGFIPLLAASFRRYGLALDLEDGETSEEFSGRSTFFRALAKLFRKGVTLAYDKLCSHVIIAARDLGDFTKINNKMAYYGSISDTAKPISIGKQLNILFSGTITKSTGAQMLIDAIQILSNSNQGLSNRVKFNITGYGEYLKNFEELSIQNPNLNISVYGRLTFEDYSKLLQKCDVGLSLKLLEGPYSKTTFPSKVLEYAHAGLVVIATDINDVKEVLGSRAFILRSSEPSELAAAISKLLEMDRSSVTSIAQSLQRKVISEHCFMRSGQRLKEFLNDAAPKI